MYAYICVCMRVLCMCVCAYVYTHSRYIFIYMNISMYVYMNIVRIGGDRSSKNLKGNVEKNATNSVCMWWFSTVNLKNGINCIL